MRLAFLVAACALLLCVVVQVFLAGMAVFVDPRYWAQHTNTCTISSFFLFLCF